MAKGFELGFAQNYGPPRSSYGASLDEEKAKKARAERKAIEKKCAEKRKKQVKTVNQNKK